MVKQLNYFNSRIDPYTLTPHPALVQSDHHYDGDDGYFYRYPHIVAPVTANAQGRIEIELPEIPYVDNTHPLGLYVDSIGSAGSDLRRVFDDPSQAYHSYRLAREDSTRPHCVWLSGDLAGKIIQFAYYGLGTVINAADLYRFQLRDYFCKRGVLSVSFTDYYPVFVADGSLLYSRISVYIYAWKGNDYYSGSIFIETAFNVTYHIVLYCSGNESLTITCDCVIRPDTPDTLQIRFNDSDADSAGYLVEIWKY